MISILGIQYSPKKIATAKKRTEKNSHGKKRIEKISTAKKNRKNSHGKKRIEKIATAKKNRKNFLGLTIYMEKKARIETHKSLIK